MTSRGKPGGGKSAQPLPPDHAERVRIETELDCNILVEAAAGTGKTTCMLRRMTALLATGRCPNTRNLAAVTFTRKAASELRGRFQISLESALRESAGEQRENLSRALAGLEQCFVGTIHSFCGRLLRERPVEAGVDPAFQELDENEDARLREESWAEFSARLLAWDPAGVLGELDRLGLRLEQLESGFRCFADYPDVDEWPAAVAETLAPDLGEAVERLRRCADHLRRLAARLPEDAGNDGLIPLCRRLPRVVSHYDDLGQPARLMEVLERFRRKPAIVLKEWTKTGAFSREDARREEQDWNRFREEIVEPALRWWAEFRYGPVLKVYHAAREIYDRMRQERGVLNYQDLLLRAASLLRDQPHVREYFRERYRFLLVDEFQDTDPVQAEVMLLLTATDPAEKNWRKCAPRPGSLFVVGDPKQSIYRFRRADIVTYNEVKEIIRRGKDAEGGGLVVQLAANFRTSPGIIGWVNRVFEPEAAPDTIAGEALTAPAGVSAAVNHNGPLSAGAVSEPKEAAGGPAGRSPRSRTRAAVMSRTGGAAPAVPGQGSGSEEGAPLRFPVTGSPESPAYVRLQAGREDGDPGDLGGVYVLRIPAEHTHKEAVTEYEPDRIARTIRHALDAGRSVTRSRQQCEQNPASGPARPSDFLLVTWKRERLSALAASLQQYGIPHQVTGGSALNRLEALKLLRGCLLAVVRPDDPVALVGALRSELFGFSDGELYAFRKAGGRFCYTCEVPETVAPDAGHGSRQAFQDTFARLRRYRGWLAGLPVLAAVEQIVADLGLMALSAARPGGDVEAGGLAKALEILRAAERETWSPAQVVECLDRLVQVEETYDGISARSEERPLVRVMNLHKVKGLEAPVVFLADPFGVFDHPVAMHIDRSGERIRGFMAVRGEKKGPGPAPLLAQPAGWESLAEQEKRFQDAETLRLRYVAATRAGSALIITQRTKSNHHNPWNPFDAFLAEAPELPDPGEQSPPSVETVEVSEPEAVRAAAAVAARVAGCLNPSYRLSGVKEYARSLSADRGAGVATAARDGGQAAQAEARAWEEAARERSLSVRGESVGGRPETGTSGGWSEEYAAVEGPRSMKSVDRGRQFAAPTAPGQHRLEPECAGCPRQEARAGFPFPREAGLRDDAGEIPGGGAETGGGAPLPATTPSRREGEHGVEWGTVIHQLLELALISPGADLQGVAQTALSEQGLDPGLAAEAEALVRSVTRSDLWKRALNSLERYVEVPFQMLAAADGPVPTLLRGQIDLVFREEDGWVVVDYKTDQAVAGEPAASADYYAGQVRLYAQAWERCTGEQVKEAALYFVREDRLVSVTGPARPASPAS